MAPRVERLPGKLEDLSSILNSTQSQSSKFIIILYVFATGRFPLCLNWSLSHKCPNKADLILTGIPIFQVRQWYPKLSHCDSFILLKMDNAIRPPEKRDHNSLQVQSVHVHVVKWFNGEFYSLLHLIEESYINQRPAACSPNQYFRTQGSCIGQKIIYSQGSSMC
jgi:hypothetical protein